MSVNDRLASIDLVSSAELPAIRQLLQTMLTQSGQEIGRGTAFPSGSATYDLFFREDRGLLCYFDGVRWLTVQEYLINFNVGSGIASTQYFYAAIDAVNSIYITRHIFSYNVSGTNNSSNYWKSTLKTVVTSGTTHDVRATDISAAGVWDSNAVNLAVVANAVRVVEVGIEKLGNPGVIDAAVLVVYRKIVV